MGTNQVGVPYFENEANGLYSNAAAAVGTNTCPYSATPLLDVDSETDSNHDTALTLACAGGHEELVELLLQRGANIGKNRVFFFSKYLQDSFSCSSNSSN